MADLLVVDDDADIAETMSEILRAEGHEVRVARDGREGLAMILARTPDLVLLDVEMPVLTGPEMAYQMLIHNCGLEKIPIVLCSAILDLEAVAAVVKTPYFMAKPISLDELLGLVARVLDERRPPGSAG